MSEIYDLDDCIFTNLENLTTSNWNPMKIRLFNSFEKKAFKFSFGLRDPKLALWTVVGELDKVR